MSEHTADLDIRRDICRRHRLPEEVAGELWGESRAQWEADAAARNAVAMLNARQQAEPAADHEPPPRDHLREQLGVGNPVKAARNRAFIEALHPAEKVGGDDG